MNKDTRITLDGKAVKLEDLSAGHRAKVVAEKDGETLIATSIDARSA